MSLRQGVSGSVIKQMNIAYFNVLCYEILNGVEAIVQLFQERFASDFLSLTRVNVTKRRLTLTIAFATVDGF